VLGDALEERRVYMLIEGIVNPGAQTMRVGITGPDGADILLIHTGTVQFDLRGKSRDFEHGSLTFSVGGVLQRDQYVDAIASASLAKIDNEHVANNAGWYVDKVEAHWDEHSKYVTVTCSVGASDSDGWLREIAYRVDVLTIQSPKSK
jgi:hypothetical protein